jgi:hypothetical protein
MTDSTPENTKNAGSTTAINGKMFLYENPVLLNHEEHSDLGLSKRSNPFEFVKTINAIPIVAAEFSSVQKHYPIVFSNLENPSPMAVVGLRDKQNLFVNADGQWDAHSYVPSYIRRYPYALATGDNDQAAVVIDTAAESVTKDSDFPFFDGQSVTKETQDMIDFCQQFAAEATKTQNLCNRIKELGLLTPQTATQNSDDGSQPLTIANYVSIDPQKLTDLSADQIQSLLQDGVLASIFSQAFSMENWTRLIARENLLKGK